MFFDVPSAVGYPPPWPLVLGLVYRGSYALAHNLLVYNLAIKIPVIAANIGLAYLVGAILENLGAPRAASRKAWTFLLLNPCLLYFGAAWGQIDAIVALFALAALALLSARRRDGSALVLALAVCFKPTALPLLPAALIRLLRGSLRSGDPLLGAVPRRGVRVLRGPVPRLRMEPGPVLAGPQRPLRPARGDVVHDRRQGLPRPAPDAGQMVAPGPRLDSRPGVGHPGAQARRRRPRGPPEDEPGVHPDRLPHADLARRDERRPGAAHGASC